MLFEIKSSGFERKLAGGIVITGGGAQLKHLNHLVMKNTGMDCRIGTPNEHLAGANDELKNPMYATGIGLVMKGIEKHERDLKRGTNTTKTEDIKPLVSPIQNKKEKEEVTGHSKRKVGSFLSEMVSKAKDWISDDVE